MASTQSGSRETKTQRGRGSKRGKKATAKRGTKRSARSGRNGKSNEVQDLEDAFTEELGDALHAERQLIRALPKMARAAQSRQLREALEMHLEETEGQVERLEQVFELLDEEPEAHVCEGMQGILSEGKEMLEKLDAGPTRDALIIASAQKVEHYEIAQYGSLCAWAEELGQRRAVDLLEETLQEEKAADKKLTRIAESQSNVQASRGSGDGRRAERGADGERQAPPRSGVRYPRAMSTWPLRRLSLSLSFTLLVAGVALAADLPPHRALRVLIDSDEVNPHDLSSAELTQPGDISAALESGDTGLAVDPAPDGVLEIPTNSIEQATTLLALPRTDPAAYDVLVYFAHRIPNNGNDALGRQQAFTAAVEEFLEAGGGMISFHHGSYFASGKEGILDLIGATANGAVPWDTINGQNVIATSPGHFVACNGVEYPSSATYADPARGVPSASYPFFNNTPDERYPSFEYNASAAGNVLTLFGSNYNQNGTTHLLGFVHRRPAWQGVVIGYQPGEYQPNALDDEDGNNFQILANAIVLAAGVLPPDNLVLEARRGPGGSDVTLDWFGCAGSFSVRRSTDPATAGSPASEIGATSSMSWIDPAPVGDVLFYLVVAQ
jgi:ferritin-like metal-binding protein YciE